MYHRTTVPHCGCYRILPVWTVLMFGLKVPASGVSHQVSSTALAVPTNMTIGDDGNFSWSNHFLRLSENLALPVVDLPLQSWIYGKIVSYFRPFFLFRNLPGIVVELSNTGFPSYESICPFSLISMLRKPKYLPYLDVWTNKRLLWFEATTG